ncbi:MAG: hypothetical protein JNM18_16050 [Planctomycetaceae bacterium]|nr:hypothetical protein [Planctomycetaceae bacterium]
MNRAVVLIVLAIHLTASAVQTLGNMNQLRGGVEDIFLCFFPGVVLPSFVAALCETIALVAVWNDSLKVARFFGIQGLGFSLLSILTIIPFDMPTSTLVAAILWLFGFVLLSLAPWIKSLAIENDVEPSQ